MLCKMVISQRYTKKYWWTKRKNKKLLLDFEQNYPNILKEANADEIVGRLQKKASQASVLESLRMKKANKE